MPLRPLAAALALLAVASAAPAQTAVKIVGNTTQTPAARSTSSDQALPFTTGPNPNGYKLTRVDFRMLGGSGTAPSYTVSVHEDSSSSPGDSVDELTNPDSWPSTAGLAQHDAPSGGINLAANTTYWLVFDVTANPSSSTSQFVRYRTNSDFEDSGLWVGWSIGNGNRWRNWNATAWNALGTSSLLVDIHGYAVSPPLVSNLGQSSNPGIQGTTYDGNFTFDRAQRFTTGSNSGGYKLTGVDLRLKSSATTAPVYSVTVQGDSNSLPDGTSLGTLTTSSTLSSSYALVGFEASGVGIGLAASTSYWVVLDISTGDASSAVQQLLSRDEDEGGPAGWGIRDASRWRANDASTWSTTESRQPLALAVRGSAASPPAVTGVALVSTPSVSDTYRLGETIQVGLTFGEAVTVNTSGGTPRLQIKMDPGYGEKWADYASGSGTATLRFDYTVMGMNRSPGGIAVLENTLALNGGTIKSTANAVDANLAHPGLSHNSDHKVDGSLQQGGSGPPEPDPQRPQTGPSDGNPRVRRDPQPLQLALWTDKPGYRAGETVRLYRTLDPHDDDGRHRMFVYLERAAGGERRYLAPLRGASQLHADAVDGYGLREDVAFARILSAADRVLSWQGEAPGPGLWQFVLELRPGAPREQFEQSERTLGTRRAWAKFSVAERSVLLNRRGFDREIRSDLTLRSDTLYYMGHQLFVHAGATLTIEPGTLVLAAGPHAAIIVEPGGRIVAQGTREAPVVLTCSSPVGWREPGCWGGLRILGRAPVTRLEGVAPGVLPAERPVYGGSEAETSSGTLSYVRVEFAGAGGDPDDPETALPAIGLYGAGSGTVLDHVQARASLGDGFAFRGGTAACERCVASGSGGAGLSWERGWRGGASHLYVQHGSGGLVGLAGGNDEQGHDREPRSLPTLSNVTLVHSSPFGSSGRTAVALSLFSGSGVSVSDLLATGFRGGGIKAVGRSALLFRDGESAVSDALLYKAGFRPLRGVPRDAVEVISEDPRLREVREFPNPDPRPKADSPALWELPPLDRLPAPGRNYIGAFGDRENWLEEWTVFGPESVYDLRQREEDED